jgi:hypothetical protein
VAPTPGVSRRGRIHAAHEPTTLPPAGGTPPKEGNLAVGGTMWASSPTDGDARGFGNGGPQGTAAPTLPPAGAARHPPRGGGLWDAAAHGAGGKTPGGPTNRWRLFLQPRRVKDAAPYNAGLDTAGEQCSPLRQERHQLVAGGAVAGVDFGDAGQRVPGDGGVPRPVVTAENCVVALTRNVKCFCLDARK